jgi:hypothetical protein
MPADPAAKTSIAHSAAMAKSGEPIFNFQIEVFVIDSPRLRAYDSPVTAG